MLYQDTIQQKLNILKDYRQGAGMWDGAIQTFDRLENSIDTLEHEARNPNVQNPLAMIGIVFLFMVLILLNGKEMQSATSASILNKD